MNLEDQIVCEQINIRGTPDGIANAAFTVLAVNKDHVRTVATMKAKERNDPTKQESARFVLCFTDKIE